MRARTERLKNRGDQLRTHGLSVGATLELYAGAVIFQERPKGPEEEGPVAVAEDPVDLVAVEEEDLVAVDEEEPLIAA